MTRLHCQHLIADIDHYIESTSEKMVDKLVLQKEMVVILKKVKARSLFISTSLCSLRTGICLSFEIPVRFIVVELNALGTAKFGEDLHDVILLLGGNLVFTMMGTVVGPHACAKV